MRMVVECYFSHLAPILGLTSWEYPIKLVSKLYACI